MNDAWFVIAALAVSPALAADQTPLAAKALFFGTDGKVVSVPTAPVAAVAEAPAQTTQGRKVATSAKKPSALGASYFIRMRNADGSTRNVLTSRVFRSGERFQLGVKVNQPSFVYIFNTDSSGSVTQLYPQPNQQNFTDAMGVVFFPPQGAFQFDNNPGVERLAVYLSPKPVPDLMTRLSSAQPDMVAASADASCVTNPRNTGMASAETGYTQLASKGIEFAAAQPCTAAPLLASKAIVFADDPNPTNGEVSSYVVKKQAKPSETLHLELRLVHR